MVTALNISNVISHLYLYPPPFSVEDKNTWNHASASPCAFMGCDVVKDRKKLKFTHTFYTIMPQDDVGL
jgi:hypothetical protein